MGAPKVSFPLLLKYRDRAVGLRVRDRPRLALLVPAAFGPRLLPRDDVDRGLATENAVCAA